MCEIKKGDIVIVTSGDIENHNILKVGIAKRAFNDRDAYTKFDKEHPNPNSCAFSGTIETWGLFMEKYIDIKDFHELHNGA